MGYVNSQGEEIPAARGLARLLVKGVRFYQKHLSTLKMVSTCRFEPTCSAYALEAISVYGAFRGTGMALARVCKCGPWHPGGFDPVPNKQQLR
ncbi:membrane protein insertion efficiency factor YidD [Corynebacterium sp. YSMAA1_1_D6]|uniref:membrane protein insertion efficiency factor YidD n=1 Tax=Corynebacterium sp. YSMAA1_1_D6 TaxID=3383589 RepID=UPI0038CF5290